MKLAVHNADGKELRKLDVDDSVFGIEPNDAVLHQAFVAGRNNQRAGTAQTKTRGEVQGSTRKIRRQKYTGRARQGGIRAPHHVGGGVAFGPVQRSYAQALPKKMKRLAIRSALSGKAADGQLVVIDQLAFERPRTKQIIGILQNVGIERSVLVVTAQTDRAIIRSLRNLPRTKALPAAYLNVVDMLNHQGLLMTEDAVRVAEQLWAVKAAPTAAPEKPARKPRATKAAAEPGAKVAETIEAVETGGADKAPKPRRRATPKAEVAQETKAAPKAKAEAEAPKPARDARKPKAAAQQPEAEKKPARAARKPKAAAAKPEAEKKPAPRRRAAKKTEGEG